MKVWTTLGTTEIRALSPDGIRADIGFEGRGRTAGRLRYNVRLFPSYDGHRERFRALRHERRINAVCWHGHRDWMRALFAADPGARVKTVAADYRGADDFEAKFEATGERNIGSEYQPLAANAACDCEEVIA